MSKKPSNGRSSARGSAQECRDRVLSIMQQFPEASAVAHGNHLSLQVRTKRFGWYLDDHHGDGRLALHCKSDEISRDQLRRRWPEIVHTPKHLGHHGWIGVWLDQKQLDWSLVEKVLVEAYRMTAPKSLAAQLPADDEST